MGCWSNNLPGPKQKLKNDASGASLFPKLLSHSDLEALCSIGFADQSDSAGLRVYDHRLSQFLAHDRPLGLLATDLLGQGAVPVRVVFFNKNFHQNWLTPWHQDRVVPVRRRETVSGFNNWSTKEGVPHVEPPFSFIENMVTLKVLLDDCPSDAGPIRIGLGTHRLGKVPAVEVASTAGDAKAQDCIGAAGDVWAFSTSILHASARSARTEPRRILHVDFACEQLPAPLKWISYTQ